MKFLDDPLPHLRKYTPELFDGDAEHWHRNLPKYHEAEWFLLREPERTRRLARLYFANILAHCDKPPSARPPMSTGGLRLFQDDPSAPPSARRLSPEDLDRWSKTTRLFDLVFPALFTVQAAYDRERYQHSTLVLRLVEQIYRRERGRPPKTVGELIGPDLPALPEGYDPDDAPLGPLDVKDARAAPGPSKTKS